MPSNPTKKLLIFRTFCSPNNSRIFQGIISSGHLSKKSRSHTKIRSDGHASRETRPPATGVIVSGCELRWYGARYCDCAGDCKCQAACDCNGLFCACGRVFCDIDPRRSVYSLCRDSGIRTRNMDKNNRIRNCWNDRNWRLQMRLEHPAGSGPLPKAPHQPLHWLLQSAARPPVAVPTKRLPFRPTPVWQPQGGPSRGAGYRLLHHKEFQAFS